MRKPLILIFVTALFLPVSVFAQADRWTAPANFHPPLNDITVTNTATLLCPANANQINCTCRNTGAETMRLGDSSVTATRGLPIAPNETFELRSKNAVYGISEGANTAAACLTEVQ